jgi:hypothetical protein
MDEPSARFEPWSSFFDDRHALLLAGAHRCDRSAGAPASFILGKSDAFGNREAGEPSSSGFSETAELRVSGFDMLSRARNSPYRALRMRSKLATIMKRVAGTNVIHQRHKLWHDINYAAVFSD